MIYNEMILLTFACDNIKINYSVASCGRLRPWCFIFCLKLYIYVRHTPYLW